MKYDGMKKEGIFRLSGDQNVILHYKRELELQHTVDTNDVYTVANLIKIYFRDLPTPLFQSISKEDICNDNMDHVIDIVDMLPDILRRLLHWLVKLLLDVIQLQEHNRMSTENLGDT